MDDVKLPSAEQSDVETPVIDLPSRSLVEANDSGNDDDGSLDFDIQQIVPRANMAMGPGPKGRLVPYYEYGWGAVCVPQTQLLGGDGKKMAVLVPLPPSGSIKMTDLKKHANKIWREARQKQMDD